MPRQPSTTYQQLQGVLQNNGCPICRLGQQATHRYLDNILYESVTDPSTRIQFVETFGFCYNHSREMLTLSGERLGIAIIEQSMLREAVRRLQSDKNPPRRSFLKAFQDGVRREPPSPSNEPVRSGPGDDCLACAYQRGAENRALSDLVEHLVGDLETPLQKAGGLCWSHLSKARQIAYKPVTHDTLLRIHENIWQDLIADLDEFIRKHDHRFRHEAMTDDESVAIYRAISALTGEDHVE